MLTGILSGVLAVLGPILLGILLFLFAVNWFRDHNQSSS